MKREGSTFGDLFKGHRIALGKTLRRFCHEHGLDPGNLSKLERGLLQPPQSQNVLERYAKCLKLRPGSDDWYAFLDRAAAEAGRIPEDLRRPRLVRRLPVFFRALRSRKMTGKQLDKMIACLRRE